MTRSRPGWVAVLGILAFAVLAGGPAAAGADADRSAAPPASVEWLATAVPCDRADLARAAPASDWRLCSHGEACAERAAPNGAVWLRVRATSRAGTEDERLAGATAVYSTSDRATRICVSDAERSAARCWSGSDPAARVFSYRFLAVELAPTPSAEAAFVCFSGPGLGAEAIGAGPADALRRRDLVASQWRAVGIGAIGAMGIFSALFFVGLREVLYLKYQGYLAAFLLYWLCQSGALLRWPALGLSADDLLRLSPVTGALAGALAALFALEFTSLRRLLPRWSRVIAGTSCALLGIAATAPLAYFALPGWFGFQVAITNGLMFGGSPVLLAAVAIAASRGDRYARFYLVGWVPLVAVTMIAVFSAATDANGGPTRFLDAFLLAGAFEAVVLSLGLADRMSHTHRELERARELADTDALTGLLNRRALLRLVSALGAAAGRREEDSRPVLVLFDLDHFKAINDGRGHPAGDACLRAFARHLVAEARRSDLVARIGGEEFAALLPGARSADAVAFAERVRARAARLGAVLDSGEIVRFTASAGVAAGSADASFEALFARADRALYDAKAAGRDRVLIAAADPVADAALGSDGMPASPKG